jgi:hypothetical protein
MRLTALQREQINDSIAKVADMLGKQTDASVRRLRVHLMTEGFTPDQIAQEIAIIRAEAGEVAAAGIAKLQRDLPILASIAFD